MPEYYTIEPNFIFLASATEFFLWTPEAFPGPNLRFPRKAGKHILHFDRNHRLVSIWSIINLHYRTPSWASTRAPGTLEISDEFFIFSSISFSQHIKHIHFLKFEVHFLSYFYFHVVLFIYYREKGEVVCFAFFTQKQKKKGWIDIYTYIYICDWLLCVRGFVYDKWRYSIWHLTYTVISIDLIIDNTKKNSLNISTSLPSKLHIFFFFCR